MKNLFLTAVLAMATLAASAQFMVVTSYDGDQEENIDKITANLGFGYQVMDKVIVGLTMQDATMNTAAVAGVEAVAAVDAVEAVEGVEGVEANNGLDGIPGTPDDVAAVEAVEAVEAVAAVAAVEGVEAVDEIVDGTVVSEMQFFARYNYTENIFLQLTSPWGVEDNIVEGATDFARLGAGYSVNVWGDINAEANYSMLIKANSSDDRKGKLSLGISMKF